MKNITTPVLLVSLLLSPAWLSAAPGVLVPAAAESSAAQAKFAGEYAGKWTGSNGDATGGLKIKLAQDAAGAWTVESSFTFEGATIPTKFKTAKVDAAKIEMSFEWEIKGSAGRSTLKGELDGTTLKGTFETSGEAGTSTGTWTVTRA